MTRSLLLSAACLAAFIGAPAQQAGAIDPTGSATKSSTIPAPSQLQNQYNPLFNDPFFNAYNQGSTTLPGDSNSLPLTFPGAGSLSPGLPTQPAPTSVPQGRVRTDFPNPGSSLSGTTSPGSIDPRLAPSYLPPGSSFPSGSSPRRWRLGVYSQDLDTGVRIEQVVPGGAASRARLEPQDVIVAVNGYQVGFVSGQLFDCSTEFERHADREGWVMMLVQNRRDKSLVNVPVQLDPRFQTLNGLLSLQDRSVALPQDAVYAVELQEIVRTGAEPVTVAAGRIDHRPNVYPIPFQIDYDPAAVDTRRNYVISARIQNANRVLYRTTQSFPAFQPGSNKTVAVALAPVQQQFDPNVMLGDRDAQIAQIVNYFQQYLGRTPKDSELYAFLNRLDTNNYNLNDAQLDLLSHNSFFNRCDANKQVYIERLHQYMVGRPPSQDELQYWMARYDASGGVRRGFVSEFQEATKGIPR